MSVILSRNRQFFVQESGRFGIGVVTPVFSLDTILAQSAEGRLAFDEAITQLRFLIVVAGPERNGMEQEKGKTTGPPPLFGGLRRGNGGRRPPMGITVVFVFSDCDSWRTVTQTNKEPKSENH